MWLHVMCNNLTIVCFHLPHSWSLYYYCQTFSSRLLINFTFHYYYFWFDESIIFFLVFKFMWKYFILYPCIYHFHYVLFLLKDPDNVTFLLQRALLTSLLIVGLLTTHSLRLFVEKVFISLSFQKDVFAGYRILG